MAAKKKTTSKTESKAKTSQDEDKKEAQELKSVEPVAVEEKPEGETVKLKSLYGKEKEVSKPKNYDKKDIDNGTQKLFLAHSTINRKGQWNYYNEYQIRMMAANPENDLTFPEDTTYPNVKKLEELQKKTK